MRHGLKTLAKLKRKLFPARSRLGRWESIPPPKLEEKYLRLDPRLAGLEENALARLHMFRTGRRPSPTSANIIPPWMRAIIVVVLILIVVALLLWLLIHGWLPEVSLVFIIYLTMISVSIVQRGGEPLLIGGVLRNDFFKTIRHYLGDLRTMPLTGEDYAVAHWGEKLLHHRVLKTFPALALFQCVMEIQARIEQCTGWSYYPSTFGLMISDRLENGDLFLTDQRNGMPMIADQFRVPPQDFNYAQRLSFLAALWKEYLVVWQPDQPTEDEERRAMLPSRANAKN